MSDTNSNAAMSDDSWRALRNLYRNLSDEGKGSLVSALKDQLPDADEHTEPALLRLLGVVS